MRFIKFRIFSLILILPINFFHPFLNTAFSESKNNATKFSAQKKEKKTETEISVRALKIEEKKINNKLKTMGTGRASSTVDLVARGSGILRKIYVQSGEKVKKGTLVAQLDNKIEAIELEKAQLLYKDSQNTLKRVQKLRATNTASAVQLIEANSALQSAKLAVDKAQEAFNQRKIVAPIDGVVGIFNVDQGNYVTINSLIVRVANLDKLFIDLWIPERFVSFLHKGFAMKIIPIFDPEKSYNGEIVALDNAVDEKSRTMHVRASLKNNLESLKAGMSFEATFNFKGVSYPAVSPLALQWKNGKPFVWKIEGNKAKSVPVDIIQRRENFILVQGNLQKDDQIIFEGIQNLHEGSLIHVEDKV